MRKLFTLLLVLIASASFGQTMTKTVQLNGRPLNIEYLMNEASKTALDSNYVLIAGTIRNDGNGWYLIDDNEHTPLNIDGVSNTTAAINLDYSSLGVVEVVSLIVAPDETYAGKYFFGSSVGLDNSLISIKKIHRKAIYGTITHQGNGVFTKSGSITSVAYNNTSGVVTITTPSCSSLYAQTHDQSNSDSSITQWKETGNALSYTYVKYKLFNMDGSQKSLLNPDVNRMTFTRYVSQYDLEVSGVNPNIVDESLGNIWIFGIMKVN